MKIFLFEFITGGGLYFTPEWGPPAGSLLTEGYAMLAAMVADLADIDGATTSIFWDDRIDFPTDPRVERIGITNRKDGANQFEKLQDDSDVVIVIAPEIERQLERFCDRVKAPKKLIAAPIELIRIASDKFESFVLLANKQIKTPETRRAFSRDELSQFTSPIVVKPTFGAGSTGVRRYENHHDVPDNVVNSDEWCVQEFSCGRAASVACLCGRNQKLIMPPMWQNLSDEFRYLGGHRIADSDLVHRATTLVESTLGCIPNVSGYIGFDLVMGDETDGRNDVVIEINPRLTTSYVALRMLTDQNLAEAMIRIHSGEKLEILFDDRMIEFHADGTTTFLNSKY